MGGHCLVKTLPEFSRQHPSPTESQKLTFFLPEVPLDSCMLSLGHAFCVERIWLVPLGFHKFLGEPGAGHGEEVHFFSWSHGAL